MFSWLWTLVLGLFGTLPAKVPLHLPPPAILQAKAAAPPSYSGPVYYKNAAVVLMYHNLGSVNRGDTITTARFEGEVSALKAAHMHIVPMSAIMAFLYDKVPLPPNAVVLTFDDGYESFYSLALPVLEKEQVPATSFVIVGRIGLSHLPSGLPLHDMTWPQIEKAATSGYAYFSSHTYLLHHAIQSGPTTTSVADAVPAWSHGSKESPAAFMKRVGGDLCKARDVLLKKVPGAEARVFAYPYGAYSDSLISALKGCGYKLAFTTKGYGVSADSSPMRLGRLNVGTPNTAPGGIVGLVKSVGSYTEAHPTKGPPQQYVPEWR